MRSQFKENKEEWNNRKIPKNKTSTPPAYEEKKKTRKEKGNLMWLFFYKICQVRITLSGKGINIWMLLKKNKEWKNVFNFPISIWKFLKSRFHVVLLLVHVLFALFSGTSLNSGYLHIFLLLSEGSYSYEGNPVKPSAVPCVINCESVRLLLKLIGTVE